jgi:hypothetical protein
MANHGTACICRGVPRLKEWRGTDRGQAGICEKARICDAHRGGNRSGGCRTQSGVGRGRARLRGRPRWRLRGYVPARLRGRPPRCVPRRLPGARRQPPRRRLGGAPRQPPRRRRGAPRPPPPRPLLRRWAVDLRGIPVLLRVLRASLLVLLPELRGVLPERAKLPGGVGSGTGLVGVPHPPNLRMPPAQGRGALGTALHRTPLWPPGS